VIPESSASRSGLSPGARGALDLLVTSQDGEECVLGRPDLGLFVAVPEAGVVFVTALQAGASVEEATARASDVAGEPVDGADFLDGLAEIGLLAAPQQGPDAPGATGRRIRWIEGVSPRTARWFFGPAAWSVYCAAVLFAAGVLVVRPDLRPGFEDAWFLGDPVLSVLVFFPIGLAIGAAHEAWHWLAGRAVGVPAVFRISRRGLVLVFETDLSQLVALPRRRRYGPFLAGMALDGVVLAGALTTRLLYRADVVSLPPVVDRFLGVVVLTQVLSLVWQWLAVFLRSDGYAVLANALRCHNLYRATWLTAKDRLWRLTAMEAAELDGIGERDRQVARWFAIGYVLGMAGTGWMVLSFALPFVIGMAVWVANNVVSLALTSVAFWESIAVLAVLLLQWIAVPVLAIRERRLRKAGELL
jgi:hypothetical protein